MTTFLEARLEAGLEEGPEEGAVRVPGTLLAAALAAALAASRRMVCRNCAALSPSSSSHSLPQSPCRVWVEDG
jgi:hypothetical protein